MRMLEAFAGSKRLAEKKSLLHMPMVDLDPASLEYGEVSGLRLALEIIKAEITADTKSKAKEEGA